MKQRLPKGEDTIPIIEVRGKFKTPRELRGRKLKAKPASSKLLIERMRQRIAQGRVFTIHRVQYELTSEEQLVHMETGDTMGLELIEAERKLLEEELRIMGE